MKLLAGHFNPVSDAQQEHTQAIAAFLTETITAAHDASFAFTEFSPENGCVLESAGQKLMPDCRFALEDRCGRRYRFFVTNDGIPCCRNEILATNGSGLFEPSDSSQWLAALPPYVEMDAGTKRLQSTKDIDSLERKARIYEQHQAQMFGDSWGPQLENILRGQCAGRAGDSRVRRSRASCDC